MDKTVPPGAALLLDFIGATEAPNGYGTIYGNRQGKLPKPLTFMTLDEVVAAQRSWSKAHGSSAAGRYQFMRATLVELMKELGVRGSQKLDANRQDRLAFHLLKRRGYEAYTAGQISRTEFGKRLAQEWASFPVLADGQGAHRKLKRGQSYYAGDGLNKALVKPETVEAVLDRVRKANAVVQPEPKPEPIAPPATTDPEPRPQPDDPGVDPADKPAKPITHSTRFWTWITTGGGTALMPFVDWRVQLLIVAFVLCLAAYAIVTMPAFRKKIGLE